jgi:hypothetical protein
MDAVFFLASRRAAPRVTSSHDLSAEPAADALQLEDPSPLTGLARVLGVEGRVARLRDATCRSFPVWDLGAEVTRRIGALDDSALDDAAEHWHAGNAASLDADPYDLALCLGELRDAIRASDGVETLFALLEERAL